MWRVVIATLALWLGLTPARSAEPADVFQSFLGAFQQLQQIEMQRKQQEKLQRQQYIQQLVTACRDYQESACHEIIRVRGMPPYANYFAFLVVGDLQQQRSEYSAAEKSLRGALRWARRMRNGGDAVQDVEQRLAALAGAQRSRQARVVTGPVFPSETLQNDNRTKQVAATAEAPPAMRPTPHQRTLPSDLVCDDASSTKWKIACLLASQDPEGAKLHAALTVTLRYHQLTLAELLKCEAVLQEQADSGMQCYQARGLAGETLEATRLQALEYELLIDANL